MRGHVHEEEGGGGDMLSPNKDSNIKRRQFVRYLSTAAPGFRLNAQAGPPCSLSWPYCYIDTQDYGLAILRASRGSHRQGCLGSQFDPVLTSAVALRWLWHSPDRSNCISPSPYFGGEEKRVLSGALYCRKRRGRATMSTVRG